MHYLRARDADAVDRALEFFAPAAHDHDDADLPWTSGAHQFIPCTTCSARTASLHDVLHGPLPMTS